MARPKKPREDIVISFRINLPDYERWRITGFVRQYPFLALAAGLAGLLLLSLLVIIVKSL